MLPSVVRAAFVGRFHQERSQPGARAPVAAPSALRSDGPHRSASAGRHSRAPRRHLPGRLTLYQSPIGVRRARITTSEVLRFEADPNTSGVTFTDKRTRVLYLSVRGAESI